LFCSCWKALAVGVSILFCPAPSGLANASSPIEACEWFQGGIVRGPQQRKQIALLFTGHEFAEGAATILDRLAERKAKASFFLTGAFMTNQAHSNLVQRIVHEAHYLGPHSDQHLLYCSWEPSRRTLVSREQFRSDLESNLQKIEGLGVKRSDVRYLLPPFEHYNEQIAEWTIEMKLRLINYSPGTRSNADYTGEADRNYVSSNEIWESIVLKEQKDVKGLNGFLLLLHLGAGPRRSDKFHARFGELLDYLAAKGYEFVRVDHLLAAP
jgi:peptidoglycan/xylan/chitin deacetylase (PgdA/CDA1 family)